MNATLKLASNLSFPIEIAGQTIALFGIRGSGKTNTAGALAEELLDHHQPIAVIDPTDAWWGLRAGRDGSAGYQVFIFGGSHADIPLQETDGKVIAEFLVHEQMPIVLSLRHLRKAAQRRFVTEFCEELYHIKGKDANRTPLTVFIDEAPLFIPQKVMGEVARTVGAVEDLIARGRNAGFGVVLISQRSATLNADVRTQADTIICHRVTAPLDRKAISDWFEENASTADLKAILQSLATLKNGEAWVWAPALDIMQRVQIRLRRTFDSSATPKIGEKIQPPKKLTDIDLEKLKGKLASTIERARAEDPKALKKQIADLQKQLKEQIPQTDHGAIEKAIATREREWLKELNGQQQVIERLTGRISKIGKTVEELCKLNGDAHQTVTLPAPIVQAPRVQERHPVARSEAMPRSTGHLPIGEQKVLTALIQYPDGLRREQLTVLTGYKRSSRDAYIARLKEKGFVDSNSDSVFATAKGMDALPDAEPLPTGEALQEYWVSRLPLGERVILEELLRAYPKPVQRLDLDESTGYKRSSRDAYLARLAAKELVLDSGPGMVKANDQLFAD